MANDPTRVVITAGSSIIGKTIVADSADFQLRMIYQNGTFSDTDRGIMVFGRDAAGPNYAHPLAVDSSGRVVISDGGASLTVDGSVTVDGTVAISSLPALSTGSNYIGRIRISDGSTRYCDPTNPDVLGGVNALPCAVGATAGGSLLGFLLIDDAGRLQIDAVCTLGNTNAHVQAWNSNNEDYVDLLVDSDDKLLVKAYSHIQDGESGNLLSVKAVGAAQGTPYGLVPLASDGTLLRAFKSDADGHLQIDIITLPAISLAAVTPGTGASNLGKAEDAAHSSGDVGVMALAVRRDTPTALAADNDYLPATTDDHGALWVNIRTGAIEIVESGHAAEVLQAGESAAYHLAVLAGQIPDGAAVAIPVVLPALSESQEAVPVSGVDGDGVARHLKTDDTGRLELAAEVSLEGFLDHQTISAIFTTEGISEIVSGSIAPKRFAIQISTTVGAGEFNARLEGSLDGENFFPILTVNWATDIHDIIWSDEKPYPVLYWRIQCLEFPVVDPPESVTVVGLAVI